MTEGPGGSGFLLQPQRVGGQGTEPGRRRRNAIAVVVVILAVAVVAFGLFGEQLARRPNLDLSFLATPVPSASVAPSRPRPSFTVGPMATDLPAFTHGDEVRSGTLAFLADGFRLLDLATGRVSEGATVVPGRDIVLNDPVGDGWLCICGQDDTTTGATRTTIRLLRIEPDGTAGSVLDDDGPAFIVGQDGFVFDMAALRTDGSTGLIAVAAGTGLDWRISVAPVDLVAGTIGSYTDLPPPDPTPSPSPSPEPSLEPGSFGFSWDVPRILFAPDGRSAFVWHGVWAERDDVTVTRRQAWRLAFGADGGVADVAPAPALADVPLYCSSVVFMGPDELVWTCGVFLIGEASGPPPTLSLRAMDLHGRVLRESNVAVGENGWSTAPLIDRANRVAYAWDPYGLRLTRIDLDTFSADAVTFDPRTQQAPGIRTRANDRPPDWARGGPTQLGGYEAMAPTPDGSRLLLLGFGPSQGSDATGPVIHGPFVVDRASLALLDRWAPAAAYLNVAVLADGRSVAFSGNPGSDAAGRQVPWQASLTIHDIDDGRIVARYGGLGQAMPPIVIPP